MEIHASLAAEVLFHIGPFAVTNAMLTAWLVMALLVIISIVVTSRMALVPESRFQTLLEVIVEFVLDLAERTAGAKVGRLIFPLVGTLFIYILTANWFGILPGIGTITLCGPHGEHCVPVLRPPNTDLNMTLAMALIAVVTVQAIGVTFQGVKGYLKELSTPLLLTPIHIIGEISHIISLSARLFGNIFGGEVLLVVMFALIPYFVPAIFMGLELFFGFIQALIFTVLTIVYISLAASGHGGGEHSEAH
jgi:F-type H+-transporting ATPase subunit a